MRAITGMRCSAVSVIAALAVAVCVRADAQQAPAAPAPPATKGFDVVLKQALGNPGKVAIAAGATRVFVTDSETGVSAHSTADLLLVWQVDKLQSVLAPVVAGDQVFIASGRQVHALDEATGRLKWARELGDGAAALVANGAGVIGAAGRVLRAWSADGVPAWEHEFQSEVAAGLIAVDAGLAYVGLANSALAAIDTATGRERWRKQVRAVARGFASSGGRVYFGGADQSLFAYTRDGGDPWRFPKVDVIGAPALDDRLVHVTLWDNTARAFDRGNGHLKWRTELPGRPLRGPWVFGDEIAVPLLSGAVVSLARKTGVLLALAKAERPHDRLVAAAASLTGAEIFEVILLENNSRELVARRRPK